MKAKLLILTIAYPGAWEVLFHVELCNVLQTLAEHGIDFVYHTPSRLSSQYNLPRDFHHSECRGDLTVYSTSSRIVQRTLDWDAIASGLLLHLLFWMVDIQVTETLSCQFLLR